MSASVFHIVQLVSKDFLKLVVLAGLIALPLSWWIMHRWLIDFEYPRVNPTRSLHAEQQ